MAESLKIGFVLDTSLDPADGVQQYVISLGEWMRAQGHNVHYLVGETARTDLPNIHSLARNIGVRFNGNRTTVPLPTSRSRLRTFLEAEKFDVLHVQTPHSPFMAQPLILSASKRTAVIGTFHIAPYNRIVSTGNKLLGYWLKPSLKRFDNIVSVSPAAAEFAKATFGIDTPVLPNVLDYRRFHDAQPWPQFADEKLTVLFLGRLVPRKGCLTLLRAVARLAGDRTVPPFRVLVCGKGPLEAELRKFMRENRLDEVVKLIGFVSEEDKPRYYASADVSVFPSTGGESFGIVLLEAMASGRATVLAGDNPGYRSVLSPRTELLFEPRNVEALAALLKKYLTDDAVRNDSAHWGSGYTADFDIQVVGKQLIATYRETLRKRRQQ